ncbi:hypothetical protein CMUS01_14824 [Colletotrichum musicola]|uniref:Uncharacterized protein n=1 Tax=Colletotrichum musicola TaxID=2175873 RepID=A0A8H6J199_9PEZI|nr:hypothetical protein CMUS01_14824 [Colletotrichum musicola]
MASPANQPTAPLGTLTQAQLDKLTKIIKESLSGDDLYRSLREFEKTLLLSFPHANQDPMAIRCYLPKSILDVLVSRLPKNRFDTLENKVHEASKIWEIESTKLLFQIGWDYANQSRPVFVQATQLAKIESSWDRCVSLLVKQAEVQRDRAVGKVRSFPGISNNDFKTVIETLGLERAQQNQNAAEALTPSDRGLQANITASSSRTPLVDEPPRKRHKSDIKSWTEGSEIERALAQIADAIGNVFVVDSESAEAAIQPDYKPNQQIAVRIAKSDNLLVVINVENESKTHLVLAVVEHKCLAARKVILMDSFPMDGTLADVQLRIDSIVKCYLPKIAY